MKRKNKIGIYVLLHVAMLIYSLSSICSKMAGSFEIPSREFVFWFAGLVVTMGVYALIWQQVIKTMPLMRAYANKAVVVLWGLLWGWLFFEEQITPLKLVGAVVIMAGVFLMVTEKEEKKEKS